MVAGRLPTSLGFVVIGRNEGERLARSLASVIALSNQVVYADSDSSDGSADLVERLGVHVVRIEGDGALTAARGRRAGLAALRSRFPHCEFVQFLDGDCVMDAEWPEAALRFLTERSGAAVACGRRFEKNPEASVYNRICNDEWDTPVGRAAACGGDAMMRISALDEVGGFRPELLAGEEPELAARLTAAGWEVWRLDRPMCEHDAAMLRFGQWWQRSKRAGFGYLQVWAATKGLPRRLYGRQLGSALLWVLGVPISAGLVAWLFDQPLLLLTIPLVWLIQMNRIAAKNGVLSAYSWHKAAMTMIAKPAELIGAARYLFGKRRVPVIDYKTRSPRVG